MKTNCKLVNVPSGIANAAQPSVQIIGHMPLNWEGKQVMRKLQRKGYNCDVF